MQKWFRAGQGERRTRRRAACLAPAAEVLESRLLLSLDSVGPVLRDFNGDGSEDVIEFRNNGQWWVGISNGTNGFQTSVWATWSNASNFQHVSYGDFNGDGNADIVGLDRWGNLWVGLSNGSNRFTTSLWATGFQDSFAHIAVTDVNDDGQSDIVAFNAAGEWRVQLSNGVNGFNNAGIWADWADAATFVHIAVGDFDGDGKHDDVLAFDPWGNWWVATGNGSAFVNTSMWADWRDAIDFQKIVTADFYGNGATDIAGFDRWGNWWVATSNFSNTASITEIRLQPNGVTVDLINNRLVASVLVRGLTAEGTPFESILQIPLDLHVGLGQNGSVLTLSLQADVEVAGVRLNLDDGNGGPIVLRLLGSNDTILGTLINSLLGLVGVVDPQGHLNFLVLNLLGLTNTLTGGITTVLGGLFDELTAAAGEQSRPLVRIVVGAQTLTQKLTSLLGLNVLVESTVSLGGTDLTPRPGNRFVNARMWADWLPAHNWTTVNVGDFNGDGAIDIVGLDLSGNWWVATSNYNGQTFGTAFDAARLWASWGSVATLRDVEFFNFGGSPATDVAGFDAQGRRRVGVSSGSQFTSNAFWAQWDPAEAFATLNGGLSVRQELNRLRLV